MKSLIIAVGLAAALAAGQGFAQQGRPGPGGPPDKGPPPGAQPHPGKAGHERGGPPGRYERMSPEERRDLRRDIDQHGREIYPDRRGGGRDRRER